MNVSSCSSITCGKRPGMVDTLSRLSLAIAYGIALWVFIQDMPNSPPRLKPLRYFGIVAASIASLWFAILAFTSIPLHFSLHVSRFSHLLLAGYLWASVRVHNPRRPSG